MWWQRRRGHAYSTTIVIRGNRTVARVHRFLVQRGEARASKTTCHFSGVQQQCTAIGYVNGMIRTEAENRLSLGSTGTVYMPGTLYCTWRVLLSDLQGGVCKTIKECHASSIGCVVPRIARSNSGVVNNPPPPPPAPVRHTQPSLLKTLAQPGPSI